MARYGIKCQLREEWINKAKSNSKLFPVITPLILSQGVEFQIFHFSQFIFSLIIYSLIY